MTSTRRLAPMLTLLAAPFAALGLAADAPAPAPAPPPPTAPVPAAEAPGRMTLPEGFNVSLFAAEPAVHQPIAFTLDHRGRLWVAENHTYPAWLQPPTSADRIVILEDADGDGHFDRRTVFWERKGANLSGIALGFGGVWVCATPDLLFIPDKDGDDKPDGEPVVKLDGWDVNHKVGHNLFNALNWGPDGWLWGCNGIQDESRVGRPGTPDAARTPMNCGVWRYHPTREVFEVVAHGTTNPWGLDFDDYGEAFITNCVIAHLFRVVPGGIYQRMGGPDYNTHAYDRMETCADHLHWAGGHWTESRTGAKHGEAGGGHAHTGAMIYLGDNWPDSYRGSLLTCNIHGHRVNRDTLERSGSGYLARHAPDFLLANDPWFRGMELRYGPDGAVYLTDWSDTGECHETDGDVAHRENGRIYKVVYGTPAPVKVDLSILGDDELARLQLHKNEWYVRTARRILQERAAAGRPMDEAHAILSNYLAKAPDVSGRLRAMWALHATGGLDGVDLRNLVTNPHHLHPDQKEEVRGWAVRLLLGEEQTPTSSTLKDIEAWAKDERSPLVRLNLASALQRLPVESRWALVANLATHAEDAADPSIPLMLWYGIEPLVPADVPRAVALACRSKIPLVRRYIARRAVDGDSHAGLSALIPRLAGEPEGALLSDLLGGMLEAFRGQKRVELHPGWPPVFARLVKYPSAPVREQAIRLALLFGDPGAVATLRGILTDPAARAEDRSIALRSLSEARVPGLAPQLQALLDDKELRGAAIRALASYADDATPRLILDRYSALNGPERDDAVATLASRPAFALALLAAIEQGTVPRRDLSTPIARQLQALDDRQVAAKLEQVWGSVRPASGQTAALAAKYKALLSADALKNADPSRGRVVFGRTCLQCHKLYGEGGDVGPELTGSDRANLDYVLGNVLDPSAAVSRDFTLTTVATADGRTIAGILREQTDRTITLQTANERIVLPREDVEGIKPSNLSMMPEGLFDRLTPDEVRDLVAYLASKSQVPLPTDR